MTEQQIRLAITEICNDSGIEDLDFECFDDVFPQQNRRIGHFFIFDGCLYHGETSGSPSYWPIGKCSDIQNIFYRLYEEDRLLDFCFEFSDMLFVLTHKEFDSCELELIKDDSRLSNKDKTEILSILKQRANS